MSDAQIRKWVESWDWTGRALETVKRLALEAKTDADTRAYVRELFTSWKPADIEVILDSGLVEQQRLFAKARRKPKPRPRRKR